MKTFREAARKKDFVLTAECFLKAETDAASIGQQADILRDSVDGVVLTDNQFGQLHMSTIAAARLMLDNDVDPIVQLSCRNRNRIVLLADLLGAASLGVTSLLLVHGNRVPKAIQPRPKAVLDMDAAELIATAASMKTDERLRSIPDLFIGSTITPHVPSAGSTPRKLIQKADAGAQFLLTHVCMDTDLLREYMKHIIAARLTRRVSIVVSTAILSSASDARWIRENRPSVVIPESVVQRLEKADDPRAEGLAICAEQLTQLAAIPGVSGANIIAATELAAIPAVIAAADLSGDMT
jgi:methylenetetrahydrofolate reductase (NADPH)